MNESLFTSQSALNDFIFKVRDSRDESAREEITQIFQPYIYRIIRGMDISHFEAEDLCQTNLLAIWQKVSSFETRKRVGAFRGWLNQIVRNSVLNYSKRQKRIAEKTSDNNKNETV